jgi:hypothetical protein
MALQTINLGTYANDRTGDDLRTAFEKVNANLIELYSISGGANIGSVPPISGVGQGELWWSTVEGRLYVYYGTAWIDASPVDGFVEYDISAVATTGGANIRLSGTDLSQDDIKIASGANITVTRNDANTITLSSENYVGNVSGTVTGLLIGNVTGNVTGEHFGNVIGNVTGNTTGLHTGNVAGNTTGLHTGNVVGDVTGNVTGNTTGLHTGNVVGDVTGNAGTVTNGVYTTGTYSNPSWITSLDGSKISGNISGNSGTVTNGVYTTSSINALADVDTVTTSPSNGQALAWNGTSWIPQSIVAGVSRIVAGSNITVNPTNGLGEVTISSPVSNVFDLGEFQQTFTDPISFLLDQVGVNFGTFTSPAGFNIDGGTF